ncbi:MAG: protein phosphatase [Pseudomonadota bacterium]
MIIATVRAGPGQIAIASLPECDADDQRIVDWDPSLVVSMTEAREMGPVHANFPSHLKEHGIDWVHLPVRNFGGLDGQEMERWPVLSASFHAALDAGGGVLVHCRGGQGRSGMIALRLLVERGEIPDAALVRIRSVRPGAVETEAQFRWAAN